MGARRGLWATGHAVLLRMTGEPGDDHGKGGMRTIIVLCWCSLALVALTGPDPLGNFGIVCGLTACGYLLGRDLDREGHP